MNKEEKFWDRQAKGFFYHEEHVQLSENKDYKTVLKYLTADATILDYGCATGIITNAISDKVKEIHAIDISSRMIEIAKVKAAKLNIRNVHYAATTIFNERYHKKSFNVIISFRVLHVLEDVPAVVRRVYELLKPGGVFISVTSCMGAYRIFSPVAYLIRKLGILPIKINFFSLGDLKKLLTDGGLQVLEYEKMDDKIPTYCVVARKPEGL